MILRIETLTDNAHPRTDPRPKSAGCEWLIRRAGHVVEIEQKRRRRAVTPRTPAAA
jgi:hypothetical protein